MDPSLPQQFVTAVDAERQRRLTMWQRLRAEGGPLGVAPSFLRTLGAYGGAQGIWVDKARTRLITPAGEGVTVAVLHTGSSYADDLAEDCILYHYPRTNRPAGRDIAEINATKAVGRLHLPFFVITYPSPNSARRDVKLGWVESWDDASRIFLITFGEAQPQFMAVDAAEDEPFVLDGGGHTERRDVKIRNGQQRFRFRVFQRYGPRCVVCGLAVFELLDAAHICAVESLGSDDPRNGLVLCANHHRAFDAYLFAVDPESLETRSRPDGPNCETLGISCLSLNHLPKKPHGEALRWWWSRWVKSTSPGS